jgi:hypothetical protein
MYTEFLDLRLCRDHWKGDALAIEGYPSWRHHTDKGGTVKAELTKLGMDNSLRSGAIPSKKCSGDTSKHDSRKKAKLEHTHSPPASTLQLGEVPSKATVQGRPPSPSPPNPDQTGSQAHKLPQASISPSDSSQEQLATPPTASPLVCEVRATPIDAKSVSQFKGLIDPL